MEGLFLDISVEVWWGGRFGDFPTVIGTIAPPEQTLALICPLYVLCMYHKMLKAKTFKFRTIDSENLEAIKRAWCSNSEIDVLRRLLTEGAAALKRVDLAALLPKRDYKQYNKPYEEPTISLE